MIRLMDNEPDQNLSFFKSVLNKIRMSRSMLNLIFIASIAFLLIINFISYYQLNNLIEANQREEHTREVIETLDSCLYNFVEIQSNQRGYLLRGTDQFLTNIESIKSELKRNLDKLAALTEDNPEQNKRVLNFIDLIELRLKMLNQVVIFKLSNRLETQEGINLINQTLDLSNNIKSIGKEIKSVELVLLSERSINTIQKADSSFILLITGNIISILFLILAFIVASIELSMRNKTESYNKNIQIRLQKIIESASDMIAALDNDYRFIIFNEAYQREFKRLFNKSIIVNMSLEEAFSNTPEDKKDLVKEWTESLQYTDCNKVIEVNMENDKNIYETTSKLIQNGDRVITGVVHSVRNITKRIQEHTELQESYQKLAAGMKELQNKNEQITLLVEMSDIMLACNSQNELSEVMSKYSQRLLLFSSGYLFIMHPSRNYLEKATSWGNPHDHQVTFTPEQCWAIRMGRIHEVGSSRLELMCSHITAKKEENILFFCVPLMAQNDIYGLLYLEVHQKHSTLINENQRLLITAFAELAALSLANVRLRESLQFNQYVIH